MSSEQSFLRREAVQRRTHVGHHSAATGSKDATDDPKRPAAGLSANRSRRHGGFALYLASAGILGLSAVSAIAGCNSGDVASTSVLSSSDCRASTTSGSYSVAIGQAATASINAVALGGVAHANAPESSALGVGALANGGQATAVGFRAGPLDAVDGATTIGAFSGIGGALPFSIAIGAGTDSNTAAYADGDFSIAIGGSNDLTAQGAHAHGGRCIAIGQKSTCGGGGYGTAVGFDTTTLFAGTAIGTDSAATGDGSTAIGRFSQATETAGAALGASSQAIGAYSTAIGSSARAEQLGAVALGNGSIGDVANAVSVGRKRHERRIINVAAAVAGTDAVNLKQVRAMLAALPQAANTTAGSLRPIIAVSAGGRGPDAGEANGALGQARQTPSDHGSRADDSSTGTRTHGATSAGIAAAAPTAAASCEFGTAKVVTAAGEEGTSAPSFSPVPQSAISFHQGGTTNGCVDLSFAAEAMAPGESSMEVRAVLDGTIEASPGRVFFAQADDALHARAFSFLFPSVPPGPHRVEVTFRNAGGKGTVRVALRTTTVQFAR